MFEAVYIADSTNNLAFEYRTNLSSPSFRSLQSLIDSQSDDSSTLPPLIEINQDYYIVLEKVRNLIIYVLCSTKTKLNPVMALELIHHLINVICDYFGTPLTVSKIEANNDTLTLLINEMIDDGIPNTTDTNRLRDLVPFKTLISKILNSSMASTVKNVSVAGGIKRTGVGIGSNNLKDSQQISQVPWRRSNVRYTNNEMYVDVIETINVLLKPITTSSTKLLSSKSFDSAFYSFKSNNKLVPITGTINGEINFLSHLTGIPELLLNFNIPNLILLPSFHQCIDIEKWESNKSLSFIPADGLSTLMNYQIDLSSKNDYLGLIDIDYQTGLGNLKNEFEIKLFIKDQKSVGKIENLSVEIFCKFDDVDEGNGDTYSNNNTKTPGHDSVINIKSNRLTHGDFSYKGKGRAEWNIRNVVTGIQPVLRGSLLSYNIDESNAFKEESVVSVVNKIEPTYIRLNYDHKGCVPSGLKVDSLKIISTKGMPEGVKPYKGVKYITKTGDFIVRT